MSALPHGPHFMDVTWLLLVSIKITVDVQLLPVVGLGLGGPEARLKRGPLMTSSYPNNSDNHF